jgi:ectoine hydroxylase-related dioxygenase (phytanoyl-CoA dioxygenase family)
LSVVDHAKLIQSSDFPIDVKMMEERVSEICQAEVHNLNPYTKDGVFHFRIIRPQSNDNNPLHRDVWLEEYHDGINIYVPICGSNEHSSLTLVPGSHYWTEDEIARTAKGARVNGIQYNVPALVDAKREMEVIRPHPKANEILVFSPYLLHGGAVNLNQDTTRISVEMRFWRKLN